MVSCLVLIFDDFNIDNKFIKKILFINCIMYTLLLLIPYVSGTSFDSYCDNGGSGKNGWFYAANETGAIMIL
ncbi:MAG: O-antigen ligase family protein, partial [Anaeroplasmataceae bacterium]|nr:O-antigen ligase family protein [Anaeroplasmataceae bacterium]